MAEVSEDRSLPVRRYNQRFELLLHHRCREPLVVRVIEVGPEDVLTASQAELVDRAKAGTLPCPWCDRPLEGEFVYYELEGDDFYAGVRLSCGCGFVEY